MGRFRRSASRARRARVQDPSNAMMLVTRGTVELMAGRRAQARAAFESALAMNPDERTRAQLTWCAGRGRRSNRGIACNTGVEPWRSTQIEFEKLLGGRHFARAGGGSPKLDRILNCSPTRRRRRATRRDIARARRVARRRTAVRWPSCPSPITVSRGLRASLRLLGLSGVGAQIPDPLAGLDRTWRSRRAAFGRRATDLPKATFVRRCCRGG